MNGISLESIQAVRDAQRLMRARKMHALGDPNRLLILELLSSAGEGDMCVEKISEAMPHIKQPTLSHHLKILLQAKMIYLRKRNKLYNYYAVDSDEILAAKEEVFSRILRPAL
jgi:ArsR family transcriptional regulator